MAKKLEKIFGVVKGHDGGSLDTEGSPRRRVRTAGVPQMCQGLGRCGCCGSSVPLSGRPGQKINTFTCQSCKTINHARGEHGGNGFTFLGWN